MEALATVIPSMFADIWLVVVVVCLPRPMEEMAGDDRHRIVVVVVVFLPRPMEGMMKG